MPNHSPRPGLRAVESDGGLSTHGDKPFEVALARALDALPYGAQRQFARAFGRSDTWVGRMRDPWDGIHVRASDSVRACQLVGTVDPLQALLDDTRVGGRLWHLVPHVAAGTIGDLTRVSMSASAELGRYLGALVDATADGHLSADERAALDRELEEHERTIAGLRALIARVS